MTKNTCICLDNASCINERVFGQVKAEWMKEFLPNISKTLIDEKWMLNRIRVDEKHSLVITIHYSSLQCYGDVFRHTTNRVIQLCDYLDVVINKSASLVSAL